jgi:glycosyltransferase involved in cell wall biosynthesis
MSRPGAVARARLATYDADTWRAAVRACRRGSDAVEPPDHEAPLPALGPGITVAVCTYKRAHALGVLLDSLLRQARLPDRLMIVDASPDAITEQAVSHHPANRFFGRRLLYIRVMDPLRGLTRQRNIALRLAETDLIAFFDDDIELMPECLAEMERAHLAPGNDDVVGVGAVIENELRPPTLLWRLRAWLGIVGRLEPGRYSRSGYSLPWSLLPPTDRLVRGDWIQGGASMWRTARTRQIGFNEAFAGYGASEDLEFSLRMGQEGRLLQAGAARVVHHRDDSGRPDTGEIGYTIVENARYIHAHCLPHRSAGDAAWFLYAHILDGLLRSIALLHPRRLTDPAYRGFVMGYWRSLLRLGPDSARRRLGVVERTA